MLELRPYQERAVRQVRDQYLAGRRRVLLVAPTGFGKTATASVLIQGARARARRVLFLVHRREILADTRRRLAALGLRVGMVLAGEPPDPGAEVQLASVQTIDARGLAPPAEFVIWDECFPAGTRVDGRPIETIRVGETVRSFDVDRCRIVTRSVIHTFRSRPAALVRLHLSDGRTIVSTPGHPYYVGHGEYANASALAGREVLRLLRVCSAGTRSQDMQPGMPAPTAGTGDGAYEPRARVPAHEGKEPDAARGVAAPHGGDAARDRARAAGSGRERDTASDPTTEARRGASGSLAGDGARDPNGDVARAGGAAESLQARCRAGRAPDRDRDRRRQSFEPSTSRTGREENGLFERTRVDRVEVLEPGRDGTFGGVCPDGHVYNLEVAEHSNYFVDEFLVHNCHHVAARTYRAIAARYPDAWHLGLTATPQRADGAGLGDAFDALVVGATVAELTAAGYLAPCDALVPLDALERGHDVAAAGWIAQDPVRAVAEHAPGRRAVVFQRSVAFSRECCARGGPRWAHIDGAAPAAARADVLTRFAAGDLDVVSNVFVLTEGWDCLDEDTEILTPHGWRGIDGVRAGDLVESLNTTTGRMESVPALDYGVRAVRPGERMARIASQHVDIRTTEGHRYHIKYRDPARGGALSESLLVRTGAQLAARRSAYALPLAAEHASEFPGVPLTDDEIRFVAWFMTDGGFEREAVCVSRSKSHVGAIRALLERIGVDFGERVRQPRTGGYANAKPLHVFRVPKGTGTRPRRGWFARFARYRDKNVAPDLHAMTRAQFAVFWAELLKGDGEQPDKSGWLWCDRREQADAYTAMAVRRGFAASYSTRVTKTGHVMYRVSVRDRQWLTSDPSDARAARITLEPPRDGERVWCVTNRNDTLVTRRNGKVVILGNCPAADTAVLARSFSAPATYLQAVGRVLRADPARADKRALIVDLGRNVVRHHLPDADRAYSLGHRPIAAKAPAVRLCRMCGASRRGDAPACWRCGAAFPPPPMPTVGDVPLVAVARGTVDRAWTADKATELDRLATVARMRGYARGWVAHKFRERHGHWPPWGAIAV